MHTVRGQPRHASSDARQLGRPTLHASAALSTSHFTGSQSPISTSRPWNARPMTLHRGSVARCPTRGSTSATPMIWAVFWPFAAAAMACPYELKGEKGRPLGALERNLLPRGARKPSRAMSCSPNPVFVLLACGQARARPALLT